MISIAGYVMGTDIYKEVFPCDLDKFNIDRKLGGGTMLPPFEFSEKGKFIVPLLLGEGG